MLKTDPKGQWCGKARPTDTLQVGYIAASGPMAMARAPDGSQVVALQPHGLEVRAFGADDLDERGFPRWKP